MARTKEGSGNVFRDLGLPDAEELQLKAELTRQVYHIIKKKNLTQTTAAKLTGQKQPDVCRLMQGKFTGFSTDRLIEMLTGLGHDVEIHIREKPKSRASARARVKAA